jgi:hypothetical protein
MSIFKRNNKVTTHVTVKTEADLNNHDYLRMSLEVQGGDLLRFLGETDEELNVTEVAWGLKMSQPENGIQELAVIKSYFDTASGEHISTLVGKKPFTGSSIQTMYIEVANTLDEHLRGLIDLDGLEFTEVPHLADNE